MLQNKALCELDLESGRLIRTDRRQVKEKHMCGREPKTKIVIEVFVHPVLDLFIDFVFFYSLSLLCGLFKAEIYYRF